MTTPLISLPEQVKIVNLLAPAADAAGRTSAYVSLKHALKAWIKVHINQGNAATILLTPLQASAVAGTGSKVLTVPQKIWSNLATAVSDTLVARTAAVSYTTDAGVALKQVIFEIDIASLDLANGFDCIGLSTGASNAANITAAELIAAIRYPAATPPSMVTD